MQRQTGWLIAILGIAIFCTWMALPSTNGTAIDFNFDGTPETVINQPLGLDLVGGLRVLLAAELPPDAYTPEELQETANSVARRVNSLGLSESTVQVQGNNRILVELPGVRDPQQAIDAIQQTALLEFVNFSGLSGQVAQFVNQPVLTTEQDKVIQQRRIVAEASGEEFIDPSLSSIVNQQTGLPFETVMTGGGLSSAAAQYDSQNGGWLIAFELSGDGREVFGSYTAANIGEPMGIVLDGVLLSAPTIQAALPNGGVISGNFTQEEAETLALQLRSGALQIPLRVENGATVGATLGQQSVDLSIRAGIIGVVIVLAFMLIYYRALGIAADLALFVFIVMNLALFKMIPVTLTLPAIAGFLISIGTAVDGNILIFERIKEEVRNGQPLGESLETGFQRAWASIRDSNTSTIIICAILFLFGQTPGASIVSAFAITLALGLVLNLFTAVIVTKTFLSLVTRVGFNYIQQHKWTLGT
ncbi:MAG: protein translocase subunit SecD [Phototrophicaceae bacterium]